jgi:hypothetical protein
LKDELKEHFLDMAMDMREGGLDMRTEHGVVEWEYEELPGVVFTLFVGPSVVDTEVVH